MLTSNFPIYVHIITALEEQVFEVNSCNNEANTRTKFSWLLKLTDNLTLHSLQ